MINLFASAAIFTLFISFPSISKVIETPSSYDPITGKKYAEDGILFTKDGAFSKTLITFIIISIILYIIPMFTGTNPWGN